LLLRHFKEIFYYIKAKVKDEEKEEEVEIDIKIPLIILKDVLDDSYKQKAEDTNNFYSCKAYRLANGKNYNVAKAAYSKVFRDIEGNRMERLKEYYAWNL